MKVRFRIRTSAGQELSFPSREVFEDFVRAGDLSPDDLVYDGESGSWAPARTHPAVLEIEYEREAAEEQQGDGPQRSRDTGSGGASGPEGVGEHDDSRADEEDASGAGGEDASGAGAEDDLGLGLELVPAPETSPEEAKRAFVEKMEAERASEMDADGSASGAVEGFTMEDSGTLSGMINETAAPPGDAASEGPPLPPSRPSPSPSKPPDRPRPEGFSGGGDPRARRDSPIHRGRTDSTERAQRPASMPKEGGGLSRLLAAAFVVALLGGGAYLTYGAPRGGTSEEPLARSSVDDPEPRPSPGDEPPADVEPAANVEPERSPAEPVIPQTTSAIRERARERFLAATQAALRDLPPVPETWATGPYLAAPSDFPDVLEVWESYLSTIRRVRAEDAGRYRAAYVSALDAAAITGDDRPTLLAAGVSTFGAMAQPREAHYDRVEALATAAIQSHNALVQVEGLILYDGSSAAPSAGGLAAGTSGRDDESQLILDRVVELLETTLEADGEGPGTGANVRAWVWDGLLDAVAR